MLCGTAHLVVLRFIATTLEGERSLSLQCGNALRFKLICVKEQVHLDPLHPASVRATFTCRWQMLIDEDLITCLRDYILV